MTTYRSRFYFYILFFFLLNEIQSQTVITSWNFNNLTKNPVTGTGTLTTIGGIVEDWSKTGINSGVSIPAGLLENDTHKTGIGLQTTNYPAQGINPKTAGIQAFISTVGYKNILFSIDVRQGSSSANKMMLQYTTDGSTWEKAVTYTTDENDTWYLRNFNFSNIPAVNNNPNFGIRLVTNFDDDIPDLTIYVPVELTTTYAPTGAVRFDNVILRGDELSVPDDTRGEIADWTFDDLSTLATNGNGTLTTLGGISVDWSKTGIIPNQTIKGEGIYDVAALKAGAGLQTLNYPTLGNASKNAGIQLNVSTLNYQDILVTADVRHGGTSANNMFLQYTTDGSKWTDATNFIVNSGDTWYKKYYDFTNISAVNNNPNFGVRYVTAFLGLTYVPTGIDKEYKTTGPIRFDNISFKGKLVSGIRQSVEKKWYYNEFNLYFNELPDSNIQIIDLYGRNVADYEPALKISLENLPQGVYIIRTGLMTGKFVR